MAFPSTDSLAAAFASARDVLTKVDDRRFGDATPCRSWDVHALINHMVGGPRFAASLVAGVGRGSTEDIDFAAGDFVAYHDETARVVMEAFGAPGALEKVVELPFGNRPAAFIMFFVATDQLVHAWDLNRAIGDSTDIAPVLAAELLEEAKITVTQDMRGVDGNAAFDPEQIAPPGASTADRLAAFLGRSVYGTP